MERSGIGLSVRFGFSLPYVFVSRVKLDCPRGMFVVDGEIAFSKVVGFVFMVKLGWCMGGVCVDNGHFILEWS